MKEPRKIVLILGNGFDLDLGLNTSYKDFWESDYCPKNYPAPLIHHLNQRWENDIDAVKWYDLENELLDYYKGTSNFNNEKDIITDEELAFLRGFQPYKWTYGIYEKQKTLVESLIEKKVIIVADNPLCRLDVPYHEDIFELPSWRDRKALMLIKDGLCKYLKSIDKPILDSVTCAYYLLLTMRHCMEEEDFVNIFTFNYTRVQMRGYTVDDIPVHYMHGNCEYGKIIVGTRDDLSVSADYDFLQKAMDGSFTPPDIVTPLKEADEVIIFGHSLGENDRQYFAPFFLRQADYDNPVRKDITIFTRDDNSKVEIKRALQKMTDGKLSALWSINQPVIIRTANIKTDQQLLLKFLTTHHIDKHCASEIIGKLIAR